MMRDTHCERCGFETSRERWWDRHPVLAVLFALPAGYTLIGVMLVYPWFTIPVTIIVCAVLLNVAARRRAAIAARADWDYRQEMLRATRGALQPSSVPSLPIPRRQSGSLQALTDSLVWHRTQHRETVPPRIGRNR
jgi:hypothetical protein